jgi:2-polyprenyl-3-methyl-5-hydroxy-6-metoxy-1,4-benzoquinol methylase
MSIAAGLEAYTKKPPDYFTGVRKDYIAQLPDNPRARILEIGCGNGANGEFAFAAGKCAAYCGVELFPEAAAIATQRLSEVVVGDIEKVALPWPHCSFDALIMSEVLEHLADPWSVLRKLRLLMRPGAKVFASSPNVAHYDMVRMLLKNEWNLEDKGQMDRTHLRWFTSKTYAAMFDECGYTVEYVREIRPLTRKGQLISFLSAGTLKHLFVRQITLGATIE